MNRLLKKYREKVIPALQKEFGIINLFRVPRITKVVVSVRTGDIVHDKEAIKRTKENLAAITGQKPLVCRARQAVADFKIRKGNPVGIKVTLRGKRMYQFLDKLFCLILPQVRDFQGVRRNAFDQQANYTLGLKEQIIFPEINYDKIDKERGMEINIITSTKDKGQADRKSTL